VHETTEGRSLDNPMRGVPARAEQRSGLDLVRAEQVVGPRETEAIFEGEDEGHDGVARGLTATWHAERGEPRGPGASAPRPRRACGKDQLPALRSASVKPRCSFGSSGEDAGNREVQANSRKAAGPVRVSATPAHSARL